jgi:hypothetical protein
LRLVMCGIVSSHSELLCRGFLSLKGPSNQE